MRLADLDALEHEIMQGGIYPPGVRRVIETAPTIDPVYAAKVCYCWECKYLGIKDLTDGYCKKKMHGIVQPNDFCSYGERKEAD